MLNEPLALWNAIPYAFSTTLAILAVNHRFYLAGEALSHLVITDENLTQKRQQNRHNDGSFRSFAENDEIDGDREKRTHSDVNAREMGGFKWMRRNGMSFFFTDGRGKKINTTAPLLQQMDREGCGGGKGADVSHRRRRGNGWVKKKKKRENERRESREF